MALSLDGTTGISASGNITGGNVIASGSLVVGSFAPASVSTAGNITGAYIIGNGSALTGLPAGYSNSNLATLGSNVISTTGTITSGNITGSNILTGGLISATGNINGGNLIVTGIIVDNTGNLDLQTTAANGNVNVIANGTGNVTFNANIMPTANATSNIGSSTLSFNTIFAKATSAQYADLAEMYCADSEYTPGTVLDFGGTEEVTITTQSHSTQVAGIVSTNPSYLMNSTLTCVNAVQVALVGRVPCSVVGTIRKGDRLVSSDRPGVAQALNTNLYQPGCIVGKALEEYNSTEPGVIEVAVGNT